VEAFTPHVPDAVLDDLRERLGRTRWSVGVPDVGWSRGVPTDVLGELVGRWRTDYDWRRTERRLSAVPQLLTTVDDQWLHVLHARSPHPDALPLVLTHGWPGSVLDYLPLVGPLTDPAAHGGDPADAFHVVIPALPGFGYSTPLSSTGWNHARIARAWLLLLDRLGYPRFGAAGGDTGSVVSPLVGRLAPDRVVGVHVHGNLDIPRPEPADRLTAAERARLAWAQRRVATDGGYAAVQRTRPHTIGHALADSPAGQLAWILDKLHDWTDPAQPPIGRIGADAVLDLATHFWVTASAASSANLYYENRIEPERDDGPGTVPTGVALFPTDPMIRSEAARRHHLVRWTEFDRGGHFAALEAPDLLLADLRAFFRPLR
jgi:epoxide hydrolase